jgi:hypothetical protein
MSTTASNVQVAGLKVSSSGTLLTKILKGTVSVTLAATAAAGEEDVSLTITGAAAGDIVIMTPLDAAMETGVALVAAWVSAADTVKIRISNVHGSSLTGSTANWSYCIIKS